jgi:hypothetical protein
VHTIDFENKLLESNRQGPHKGALFHAKREIGTSKNWNICAAITRAKDDLVKFYQNL